MKKVYIAPALISHKIRVEAFLLSKSELRNIDWGNNGGGPDVHQTDIPVIEDDEDDEDEWFTI